MTVVNQLTLSVALLLLISFNGAAAIDPLIGKVLETLYRIIYFFTESLDPEEELVPDLLFGLALGVGQVRVFIRHLEENVCTVNVSAAQKQVLLDMLFDIDFKMSSILRADKRKVPKKRDKFTNLLVDKMLDPVLWTIDQPLQEDALIHTRISPNITLDEDDMYDLLFGGLPNEEMSDFCLGQILGIRSPACYVSSVCRRVIIDGGPSRGYPLTHRLFYVQAARQANCDTLGPPQLVEGYVKLFCSSILAEAELIAVLNFPSVMIDLFAEQVALCGAEGFKEFTRQDWIEEIISWQRPEGCFGTGAEFYSEMESDPIRRKREDSLMEYDCLMHFTGVATAAIATSIRPMVECSDYDYMTRPKQN